MDHIAIMRKSWGLIEKILSGEKTVESRWYKVKYLPWDRIKKGDNLYFKNSGERVGVSAEVKRVLQISCLTQRRIEEILKKYGERDLGTKGIWPEIREYVKGKKYAILIFFSNVKKIKPFSIKKKGMASWITIEDIDKIKI